MFMFAIRFLLWFYCIILTFPWALLMRGWLLSIFWCNLILETDTLSGMIGLPAFSFIFERWKQSFQEDSSFLQIPVTIDWLEKIEDGLHLPIYSELNFLFCQNSYFSPRTFKNGNSNLQSLMVSPKLFSWREFHMWLTLCTGHAYMYHNDSSKTLEFLNWKFWS